jgi:hypothetical protein
MKTKPLFRKAIAVEINPSELIQERTISRIVPLGRIFARSPLTRDRSLSAFSVNVPSEKP